MSLIWATRGRKWGFRFLLDGGLADPLGVYEHAFTAMGDAETGCCQVGQHVALRIPDPLDRKDSAGRVIPHDFVVIGPHASSVTSVTDGLQLVWPRVKDIYAQVWDRDVPPSIEGMQSILGYSGQLLQSEDAEW